MMMPVPEVGQHRWSRPRLRRQFDAIRSRTEELAAPLPIEDQVVRTINNVSPTKWHLGHTTWFFETFVLSAFCDHYQPYRQGFEYIFNSYYQGAGAQFPRHRRGTLGRPTTATVIDYRHHVDQAIRKLLDDDLSPHWASIIEVGLHHEQQHQELILTDIKHVLASNPLRPVYDNDCAHFQSAPRPDPSSPRKWLEIPGEIYLIGHNDNTQFCFDNERPQHRVLLDDFEIASKPVTCAEFIEFINADGYENSQWWLSEGWETVGEQGWKAPLYWERRQDQWWAMTLGGMRQIDANEPICHISYFEADAFARWSGARLPTEAEWEVASRIDDDSGNFAGSNRFHPLPCTQNKTSQSGHRFFGDVWEWTASAYAPYPGFEPWDDTLGEYNGKFMCNQYVLRGGSCATDADHIRRSYRNFFHAHARWQFSGLRLAR